MIVKKIINKIKKSFKMIIGYWIKISILPIRAIELEFSEVGIKIIKLKKSRIIEKDRFSYQKKYLDFNIREGEKVLDIGSGGFPFPLATHVADYYEEETSHRTEKIVKDDRPFINCSINDTPFDDKEFDFVYCSHVLEHVDDPVGACDELMRIGKRGYIETPTRLSDVMFNFTRLDSHHKWHINIIGDRIVFMEWAESERRDMGTDYFFNEYHSIYENTFKQMMRDNRDIFCNMFLWKSRFLYTVIDKTGKILKNC